MQPTNYIVVRPFNIMDINNLLHIIIIYIVLYRILQVLEASKVFFHEYLAAELVSPGTSRSSSS